MSAEDVTCHLTSVRADTPRRQFALVAHTSHVTMLVWRGVFLCLLLGRALALTMTQDKLSMTKGPGKTVRIGCKSDGSPSYIHWYRQKGSGDLERILYVQTSTGAESYDIGDSERFKADDKGLILRIDRAVNGDTATYYCAAWDSHSDANHGDPLTKTSARLNKAAAKPNGLVRLITNTPGSMNAALLKRMAALEVSGILWCPVNSG